MWIYKSIPQYAFMTYCLDKRKDEFAFSEGMH
jgi:hypothetical protein